MSPLFEAPERNHNAICVALFELAKIVAGRIRFNSIERRHEAIADATLYAIERRGGFRQGGDAECYFGKIIYRRMRRQLKRRPVTNISAAFPDEDGAPDSAWLELPGCRPYTRGS